jgi:hypothetical protein
LALGVNLAGTRVNQAAASQSKQQPAGGYKISVETFE